MPFGLCNAPSTFQSAMDTILREEIDKFAISYLDDIIIYSKYAETHKKHLEMVFMKLKETEIFLNKKKCKLGRHKVKILSTVVSEGQVGPDSEKIECIKTYPLPTTVRELRSFLGLLNYCREFIKNFATKAKPLFDLLKGETKRSVRKLIHTTESKKAFIKLREEMTEETARAQPDFDQEFILTTDASEYGIGGILG
ncbi:Retrovirus-related Pol polyprotein from transposon [Nosema granulosis]|uniref:Retrovirus-related Pol polyprotein from transposon n=1 Tax=Nosema granulosis TaxID=83296 RepID=A0A9P6GYR7_9MICR|nr:Retrovirus-related Pol polyprotein from transposon [Nosema granulosis]